MHRIWAIAFYFCNFSNSTSCTSSFFKVWLSQKKLVSTNSMTLKRRDFCATRIWWGTFLIVEDFYSSLWNWMLNRRQKLVFCSSRIGLQCIFYSKKTRERLWKPTYLNWLQTLKIANLWIGLNQISRAFFSHGKVEISKGDSCFCPLHHY